MNLLGELKKAVTHPKKAIAGAVKSAKNLIKHPKKGGVEVLKAMVTPVGKSIGKAVAKSKTIMGTPAQEIKTDVFDPDQMEFLQKLIQQVMQQMGGTGEGDPIFQGMEQQARSQFENVTAPSIAERFTAMGPGMLKSSAFEHSLRSGGQGLERRIAMLKPQLAMQRFGQLAPLALTPRHHAQIMPPQPGLLHTGGQEAMKMIPLLTKLLAGGTF